jgi:hypothetical protein
MKKYNMKRHYSNKHSQYESFQGQLRNNKIENLYHIVWASFVVSEKTVKHPKLYSDGEFVKECLVA